MLKEAAQELHGIELHGALSVALLFPVPEEDLAVSHLNDSVVGYGHPEDVGRQVFDARLAVAHRLGVNVPGLEPNLLGDCIAKPRLLHPLAKLGAEYGGEGLDRQEEVLAAAPPAAVCRGDRSAGDHVMDVGMVLELPAPGVQDAEEARQVTAHVPGVEAEFLHRRR